jgi:hypothetical protein
MSNLTISDLIGTLKSTFKINKLTLSAIALTANRTITIQDKDYTVAGLDDLTSLASQLNPVGTIREFNVATNPATLLGFGTWVSHGTGRVTVAIDAGQTEFNVLEKTGGEKAHLSTSAESGLPPHTHALTNGGFVIGNVAGGYVPQGGAQHANTTIANAVPQDATVAHNNLQPYIVVYRWVRTA